MLEICLLFQFGFDGLFFGRLDYQDKAKREKTRTMELMWRGSDDLGESYGWTVSSTIPCVPSSACRAATSTALMVILTLCLTGMACHVSAQVDCQSDVLQLK